MPLWLDLRFCLFLAPLVVIYRSWKGYLKGETTLWTQDMAWNLKVRSPVPLTPLPARPKSEQTCAGRAYNVRAPQLVSPATLTQNQNQKGSKFRWPNFQAYKAALCMEKTFYLISSPSEGHHLWRLVSYVY